MKKLFSLLITMLLPMMASAYDLADDKGIHYNIKGDGTLEVDGLDAWTTIADILSDVTIGGKAYRVTSIKAWAFEGRSDLQYLSIPWTITSIGEYAFIDCGSNITVNIADPECWCQMKLGNEHASPLSSAGKVLVHDIETTTIDIPKTVTSIGKFTFYQCRKITSLNIPSSVKSIGSSAFEDCTGLTSLTLSEGLQFVGGSAFEGCTGLKSLIIPSTVNTIKMNAFRNCKAVTDVYCYAQAVPNTDDAAFDDTPTESATLHVPSSVVGAYKASWPWNDFKEIVPFGEDSQAFTIKGINYRIIDSSKLEVIGPKQNLILANIPEYVDYNGKEYQVTKISNEAFKGNKSLRGVKIPQSIIFIGDYAFDGCSMLQTVFADYQEPIDISQNSFYGVSARLVVAPGTKDKYLSGYGWKDAFESIEEYVEVINVHNPTAGSLSEIMSGIDNRFVKRINVSGEFNGTDLRILRSFVGCVDPCDGKYKEYMGFSRGIFSILDISKMKIVSGGHWYSHTHIDDTGIPDNEVLYTEDDCISPYAFFCGDFSEVYLPKSIKTIKAAFIRCNYLTDVYCYAESVPSTNASAFEGSHVESATLHVPKGCSGAYKSMAPWKSFKNIVEIVDAKIKLSKTKAAIEKGKTLTLKATVTPSDLPDKSVTWNSSNTKVATVTSKGKVKGLKAGTATITCTSKATGAKATCKVTVGYVKLNKTEAVINKGKTVTLKATVYPSTLKDRSVTWKSSNTKVATVSSKGKVKGVKAGTATITCTSNATGLKATCKVTVGYVKLDQSEVTVKKGKTVTLKAAVYPSTLEDKSVTWESSNKKVATVTSKGKVKGIKAGFAVITCTSNATGLSTTCIVKVKATAGTRSLEDDDNDELTEIDEVETSAAIKPFDVYDLSGRKVLNQVTSLDGLSDGIYIVNGKKILKKK